MRGQGLGGSRKNMDPRCAGAVIHGAHAHLDTLIEDIPTRDLVRKRIIRRNYLGNRKR